MAKMPRHEKMYSESPMMGKDEHGKPAVKKAEKKMPEKEADGMHEHNQEMQNMHMKHMKERMELSQKHETEHMAAMHKSMKKGAEGEKTGGEDIKKKIEAGKKE